MEYINFRKLDKGPDDFECDEDWQDYLEQQLEEDPSDGIFN
jgi:hypothetical protein